MSNLVLYRKYRPQKFAEVVAQDHVKSTLSNAVTGNRIAHAYLFTGPRGVGKTTLARIFARAVNCPNVKDGEPCNVCDICKEFLSGVSLDVMEIDAASNTGVDNIRDLIEHIGFAPTRGKYKVIIVDEVHMLSKGAFNALLKTLEEPPKHAIFILATTEIHKVPPTIISRTQRFDFRKINITDLIKLLKYVAEDSKVKITDEALLSVAEAADGSFRDGLSLLDQVINYSSDEVNQQLVEEVLGLTGIKTVSKFYDLLLAGDTKGSVNFIDKLMYSGKDLFQFQKDFLEYLRKILLIKTSAAPDFGFTQELKQMIKEQAQSSKLPQLINIIEIFQKAGSDLKWASITSLPLELAAVEAASMYISEPLVIARSETAKQSIQEEAVEIKEVVVPMTRNDNSDTGDFGKVLNKWSQILEKTKEYNHALLSTLKLAKPVAVSGNELILTFPYKFHKDTIEARKNKIVLDQVIEEVIGQKLFAKPILDKEWDGEVAEIPSEPKSNTLKSALEILGGEIAE